MKYDLMIFDADKTLFDTEKAMERAFNLTFNEFGVYENLDYLHSEYKKINKVLWGIFESGEIDSSKLRWERFRLLFEKNEINLDYNKFSKRFLHYFAEGTFLLDGAKELIELLHNKTKLALATNGFTDVQTPRFARSEIAKYFPHIFISDEMGFPKPHIKYFEIMFQEMKPFSKAIIVGDSLESDILGGNVAGIDTCWFNSKRVVNETGIIPTYEINKLADLLAIIE